jgi:hypothetical protein
MSLGKKKKARQQSLWVPQHKVARSPGHPFHKRLNAVSAKDGVDEWAEATCAPLLREGGRPSIPPGVPFRMILVGDFEGLGSERGIAWRCVDSLLLREFLGTGGMRRRPSTAAFRSGESASPSMSIFLDILSFI